MKATILSIIFIIIYSILYSQNYHLKVWPENQSNDNEHIDNSAPPLSDADLYVYLPEAENNTGAAAVICPGGGYIGMAMEHEGHQMAKWLIEEGVAGIVLKYRLPNGHDKVPLQDAQRAIRIVRSKAEEWNINPDKIGIAGSSAGGHLASTAGVRFDDGDKESDDIVEQMSSRPNFMLLLYPVISFNKEFGHLGSAKNLLGNLDNKELIEYYSNELHVRDETPPAFIILADDDTVVLPQNSIAFYSALKQHNIPAEMHIFREGKHGFGMTPREKPVDQWPNLFIEWMEAMKIIE